MHRKDVLAIHLFLVNDYGFFGASGVRDTASHVQCRLTILVLLVEVWCRGLENKVADDGLDPLNDLSNSVRILPMSMSYIIIYARSSRLLVQLACSPFDVFPASVVSSPLPIHANYDLAFSVPSSSSAPSPLAPTQQARSSHTRTSPSSRLAPHQAHPPTPIPPTPSPTLPTSKIRSSLFPCSNPSVQLQTLMNGTRSVRINTSQRIDV